MSGLSCTVKGILRDALFFAHLSDTIQLDNSRRRDIREEQDELSPEDIRIVMEHEYMSQTEMMRTLETLVASVGRLEAEYQLAAALDPRRHNHHWRECQFSIG